MIYEVQIWLHNQQQNQMQRQCGIYRKVEQSCSCLNYFHSLFNYSPFVLGLRIKLQSSEYDAVYSELVTNEESKANTISKDEGQPLQARFKDQMVDIEATKETWKKARLLPQGLIGGKEVRYQKGIKSNNRHMFTKGKNPTKVPFKPSLGIIFLLMLYLSLVVSHSHRTKKFNQALQELPWTNKEWEEQGYPLLRASKFWTINRSQAFARELPLKTTIKCNNIRGDHIEEVRGFNAKCTKKIQGNQVIMKAQDELKSLEPGSKKGETTNDLGDKVDLEGAGNDRTKRNESPCFDQQESLRKHIGGQVRILWKYRAKWLYLPRGSTICPSDLGEVLHHKEQNNGSQESGLIAHQIRFNSYGGDGSIQGWFNGSMVNNCIEKNILQHWMLHGILPELKGSPKMIIMHHQDGGYTREIIGPKPLLFHFNGSIKSIGFPWTT